MTKLDIEQLSQALAILEKLEKIVEPLSEIVSDLQSITNHKRAHAPTEFLEALPFDAKDIPGLPNYYFSRSTKTVISAKRGRLRALRPHKGKVALIDRAGTRDFYTIDELHAAVDRGYIPKKK